MTEREVYTVMTTQPGAGPEEAARDLEQKQPPPEAAKLARAAARDDDDDDDECSCRFAVVASNGVTVRGRKVVSSALLGTGFYQVVFNRDVRNCAYVATIGDPANGSETPGEITVATRVGNNNGVFVSTHNSAGVLQNHGFHLIVLCPG
jgi:hypothetical protein